MNSMNLFFPKQCKLLGGVAVVMMLFTFHVNAQDESSTETTVETQTETRTVDIDRDNDRNESSSGPRVGIKGGLNASNLITDDVTDKHGRFGFHAGIYGQ